MNKRKRERMRKRLFRLFGTMVAMCLMLTSISVHLIFAESKSLEKGDLIPASVTVDTPKALSKISLPASSYGTLKWKDDKAVPSSYSSSYEVIFTADSNCTEDFSNVKGFNSEKRTVTGTVTVYVKSLAPAVTETPAATETPTTPAVTETPTVTETPEITETPSVTPEPTQLPEVTVTPDPDEENAEDRQDSTESDEDIGNEGTAEDLEEDADLKEDTEKEDPKEEDSTDSLEDDGEESSDSSGQDKGDSADGTESADETEAAGETEDSAEKPSENPEVTEKPEITEIPDNPMELVMEEERPETVSEDMTLEEQAAAAAANHTSQGITVSADFLPWYVQFRVSDGSGFAFTNAEDASTFQAYEFQLWDLLNDTEYTIPEGESVQVTMPAIEGYEYTIQHIRPDGSIETIVPEVYGSTMVFSTDSFSPFGIAGSKPLVGGDIADNGYGSSSSSGNSTTGNSSGSSTGSSSSSNNSSSSSSGNTGSSTGSSNSGSSKQSSSSSGSNTNRSTSGSSSSSVKTVKTGDTTNIMPFVLIGIGALLVILAVVFSMLNRRKK